MNSLEVALKVKMTELRLKVYLTVRVKVYGFCPPPPFTLDFGVAFNLQRVRFTMNYKKCLPKRLKLRVESGVV